MAIERLLGRLHQRRMIGEPEIVVGAEVEHLAPALHADHRALRALDDALTLEKPLLVQRLGLLVKVSKVGLRIHGAVQ